MRDGPCSRGTFKQSCHRRPLLSTGVATIIARRRQSRMRPRARRIFNVHAHADRRAPPGGDPGRSRQGNRIEEFDFESAEHKQLKGNIYLAKVTRVEPSLQAAFIDYGGNRHGFLAFSEIHPDYYQIPKADRDALLREEAEHAAEEERLVRRSITTTTATMRQRTSSATATPNRRRAAAEGDTAEAGTGSNRSPVDESAADELRRKRQALRRRYKIQDVIQRRQVLLVQVVKEERGNKGAALTTYLSRSPAAIAC